ncbi:hypothetical protein CsSME_00044693 [Camellia sinensis var. sinensis]|uniref:uncharacterized protein LOC114300794 n=1 Tax=Camellia sinensis TaxID=4442 RepID=UPI001036255B|nr:uncharacterized protein LOC114300794 [Camellia sinensis]
MISHTHATDTQTKSTDLASKILAATTPQQIAAVCGAIESFLHKHTPDQTRWFFSITFPTLICKIFGFAESPPHRPPQSPTAWVDSVDSELASRVFNLLSPIGVLMSSISAVDRLSLMKYVFPIERLPEWVRFLLQSERDCRVLADFCPLFKGRIKEDSIKGSFQVQLNVFEYYFFWFAYYPVCRGNNENSDTVRVRRSRKFRLENWASSFPGLSTNKRGGSEQKVECGLYLRLLYSYLRAFVPISVNTHQPYRSSLLHYNSSYDNSVVDQAEFIVNALKHFWLVDNDFSPVPVNVCKSFGGSFPFRSVLGETPPTSGLGEVVNLFVKYLNLSSVALTEVSDQVECSESPRWRVLGSSDVFKSRNAMSATSGVDSIGCWNSWIQRPLYRFILRTFLFCPVETSIKNASQVFSVWISYMEPWTISLEDFKELEADVGTLAKNTTKVNPQYSSSWQAFVLSNYLFYSSLVMHFFGFAHKFLHTDPEVIVQMVSKVINILTSSGELIDLIKIVDTVFHSKPATSSKSMLNSLYRFVPTIREQLQDWEDGLCESDADGSFLHANWNKDLRLFSDGDDGGQQLLQLFVLRAESELQAVSGDNLAVNLQCLDSLKNRIGCLYGGPIIKSVATPLEGRQRQESRNDIFKPRRVGKGRSADIEFKGDWMKRPISNDEVAWLAKLLVSLSGWLNENLGLNQGENSPALSYVEVSGDLSNVCGPTETMKVLLCSVGTWFITSCCAAIEFMKKHGLRVNLRMLASKKVVTVLLAIVVLNVLRKAITKTQRV